MVRWALSYHVFAISIIVLIINSKHMMKRIRLYVIVIVILQQNLFLFFSTQPGGWYMYMIASFWDVCGVLTHLLLNQL